MVSMTTDIQPVIIAQYSKKNKDISWGAQIKYKRSLNDNNGWHFGNKLEASSWMSYLWNEELSSAIRFLAIDDKPVMPKNIKLFSNFPNPFNPSTNISYNLSSNGRVKVSIHDMLGRLVTTLIDKSQNAGFNSITWNGTNIKNELKQNYYSLIETRAALKSVVDVTDSITSNWKKIDSKMVKRFYYDNQYALRDDMKTILGSRPSYNPKNLYFNSMIYSGLILEIKNIKLRENLEQVYKTIDNSQSVGRYNSNDIYNWFDKLILREKNLNQEDLFDRFKDFELLKLLYDRRRAQVGFLFLTENNIKSFEKLLKNIENPNLSLME